MDPGELDKMIGLVRSVPAGRDAAGAPTPARGETDRVWAKGIHPGGREFLAQGGEVGERRVVFRIWTRDDVDTGTVVAFKDQDHDIQDIRPFDDVMELHTIVRSPVAS